MRSFWPGQSAVQEPCQDGPSPARSSQSCRARAKRRQVDASRRTTRSRALAQQGAAPAAQAGSPVSKLGVGQRRVTALPSYTSAMMTRHQRARPEPPAGAALPAQPGRPPAQQDDRSQVHMPCSATVILALQHQALELSYWKYSKAHRQELQYSGWWDS